MIVEPGYEFLVIAGLFVGNIQFLKTKFDELGANVKSPFRDIVTDLATL